MSGYGEAAAGQSRPRHGDGVVGAGRGGRRELFCTGRLRESSTKKTGPQPAQRPGMDVTNSADGSPAKTGSCQRRSEQSPATRLKPHRNPHRTLALDSDLPSHGSPDRQGGVAAWTRGIRHRPRSPFGCGSSALGCLSLNCTKRNQAGTSWVESFPRVG